MVKKKLLAKKILETSLRLHWEKLYLKIYLKTIDKNRYMNFFDSITNY